MKIIKKEDVSRWNYKHKCINCDTELLIEAADVKYYHYDGDFREPSYDTYTANCIVCGKSFNIPIRDVPKLIQVEARKRQPVKSSGYNVR